MFCNKVIKHSKLTRHIKLVQKFEPRALEALSCDDGRMRERFGHFRIERILTYNLKEMNKQTPVSQSERQGTNQNKV